MEKILEIYNMLVGPGAAPYWLALFGVSEALALIPVVKQNSIFQAVMGVVGFLKNQILKLIKPV